MVSCALRSGASRTEEKRIQQEKLSIDSLKTLTVANFVNRGEWTPTRSSVICSKYFSEESFDRTSKCYVNLKPNAVPTIHENQVGRITTCQDTSTIKYSIET
ncbi:unnamed protein product [Acanthoscelides obtectus]|uniref:THAP-type domain-containing protein n=1 Tax=Acanthoscelides obtectus TaxID=200917 RepID=A0A9P0P5Q0_ACAOB|nr:unnamed protein product [Acanthoscelides obtectus]CAK1634252.1 hypothetical protein AOBTE_LOCUS8694 [Acanthoscelides obtectus]